MPPSHKDVTLGLVLSENTKSAMKYAREYSAGSAAGTLGGGGGTAENMFQDIAGVFQRNFKAVVKVNTPEEARAQGVDLVAILDIFTQFPNTKMGEVKVNVSVMFLADNNAQIDVVKVDSNPPIPIWDMLPIQSAIKSASAETVSKLEAGLRSSMRLAEFSRAKTGVPAAVAVKPQDHPAPARVVSDVDTLPALKSKLNKHAVAIVIGIEQYRERLPKAEFADRDATLMGEYLTKVLGYPEANVVVRINDKAAKTDFEKYFEAWLPNNVEKDSSVFIYYSGHGAPNPKTGDAYLVPYDGDPTFVEKTGYSLKRLYAQLEKLPVKDITVVMDSCFSGAGGRSVLAQGAKPMGLSVEHSLAASGKTVVLAASAGDQISSAYMEKGHGLLTYFFLKGLQGEGDLNKDGITEMAELYEYVKPNVQAVARKQYNNEQTPQLMTGPEATRKGSGRLIERGP